MIKNILWDVDGTLLNFKDSEKHALSSCLMGAGIRPTDEMIAKYSEINKSFWEKLERGELTRDQVLVQRFEVFFDLIGKKVNIPKFEKAYQEALANVFFYYDNSLMLCQKFKEEGFRQYVVTNGVASTQNKKLRDSKFFYIMDDVFISDEIGHPKPNHQFFKTVFDSIPNFSKEETIIIGDSLTSDIRGGNNAGIQCCWYNPRGEKPDLNVRIDYEIKHLWELQKILNNNTK